MLVRSRDQDDEEDDAPRRRRTREPDSDDRPVKKKKKRKKASGSGIPPALLFGGGGVFLLAIIAVVIVVATQGGGKTAKGAGDGSGNVGANPAPGNGNAIVYNQKLDDVTNRLRAVGTPFGEALKNYFAQGGKDAQGMRGQVQNLQNNFRSIRAEVAAWPVPSNHKGQMLREAYLSYLDSGDAWAKELGAILENGSLSQPQKLTQAQQLTKRVATQEQAQLTNVRRLQTEFAMEK